MTDEASSAWLSERAGSGCRCVVVDATGRIRHVGLAAFEGFDRSPEDVGELADLLVARFAIDRDEHPILLEALTEGRGDLRLRTDGAPLDLDIRDIGGGLRLVGWTTAASEPDAAPGPGDAELLGEILAQVDHGIILYDRDGEGRDVVRLFNRLADELLETPKGFLRRGRLREEIVRHCIDRGDYGGMVDAGDYLDRIEAGHEMRTTGRRPSGRYVESVSRQRADGRGSLALAFDVSATVAQINRLKDVEEHYRLMAQGAPTGIVKVTAVGEVAFANDAAIDLLERTAGDIDLFAQLVPTDGTPLSRHLDTSTSFDAQIRRSDTLAHVMVSVAPSRRRPGSRILTLADVSTLREAKLRIEHLAHHDPLTGLGNRGLFALRWAAIEASDAAMRPAHLIVLDLDRFKLVNDDHGHHMGDLLLRSVAARLDDTVGTKGEVFRLGGDEFAVIVADLSREAAIVLARQIVERLALPFDLGGVTTLIGCSAGIASMPADGTSSGEVQRAADIALYTIKHNGRNGVACYDPTLARHVNEQRRLVSDLALALAGDEFRLEYQPIFDVGSGRVVRVEALLRWHNRRLAADVDPDALIRLAEEASLVTLIDLWVMRTAIAGMRAFIDAGVERPALSINMSRVTLSRPEVVERIRETLAAHRVEASLLEIEVKQGAGRPDLDAVGATLAAVRRTGITVALDDFGSGDTALSTLRTLPFDRIKLDRSITEGMGRDVDAEAIASAVLGICRRLDRRMTAEGVETPVQRDALRGLGAIDAQGSLLAPPETAGRMLERLLREQNAPLRRRVAPRARSAPAREG